MNVYVKLECTSILLSESLIFLYVHACFCKDKKSITLPHHGTEAGHFIEAENGLNNLQRLTQKCPLNVFLGEIFLEYFSTKKCPQFFFTQCPKNVVFQKG